MKKLKTVIYLTCCEHEQKRYYEKIICWYNHMSNLFDISQIDIKVFNDGLVYYDEKISDCKIEMIELKPKLGRKSVANFPGYFRSFYYMMEDSLQYDNVLLLENDVYLTSRGVDKINEYWNRSGNFCGYSKKYGFIETALMILNDVESRKQFIDCFLNNYNHDIYFEKMLEKMVKFDIVFKGERYEGNELIWKNKNHYDYIAQFDWSLL